MKIYSIDHRAPKRTTALRVATLFSTSLVLGAPILFPETPSYADDSSKTIKVKGGNFKVDGNNEISYSNTGTTTNPVRTPEKITKNSKVTDLAVGTPQEGDTSWVGNIKLKAIPKGGYPYYWSPSESPLSQSAGIGSEHYYFFQNALPTSVDALNHSTTVTVKNASGASYTYTVRWHLPFENYVKDPKVRKNPYQDYDNIPFNDAKPKEATKGGSISGHITWEPIESEEWIKDAIIFQQILEPGEEHFTENPIYLTLFKAIEIGSDHLDEELKEQNEPENALFNDVFEAGLQKGQPGCTYDPMPKYLGVDGAGIKHWSPDIGKYVMTNPTFMKEQRISLWVGESYGPHGFEASLNHKQEIQDNGAGYTVADFEVKAFH